MTAAPCALTDDVAGLEDIHEQTTSYAAGIIRGLLALNDLCRIVIEFYGPFLSWHLSSPSTSLVERKLLVTRPIRTSAILPAASAPCAMPSDPNQNGAGAQWTLNDGETGQGQMQLVGPDGPIALHLHLGECRFEVTQISSLGVYLVDFFAPEDKSRIEAFKRSMGHSHRYYNRYYTTISALASPKFTRTFSIDKTDGQRTNLLLADLLDRDFWCNSVCISCSDGECEIVHPIATDQAPLESWPSRPTASSANASDNVQAIVGSTTATTTTVRPRYVLNSIEVLDF